MIQLNLLFALIFLCGVYIADTALIFRLIQLDNNNSVTVVKEEVENSSTFFDSDGRNEIAKAFYDQAINETGWAFLEIHTNASFENGKQAWGAGYLEGYATYDLIYMAWYNTFRGFCDGREEFCKKLDEFSDKQTKFMNENILGKERSEYWEQVLQVSNQVTGLHDGYNKANTDPEKNLPIKAFYGLNLQGDVEDLSEALKVSAENFNITDYLPLKAKGVGHCSALIKVLPDGSDIFVSQVTWNTYQSMLRIQKKYVMPLRKRPGSDELIPGVAMSFSSYPGVITSGDDFYLISTGLVTLETTIGNGNASLWKYVQPETNYEFLRSMVANRLATDGRTWTEIFSKFNSGTYNNQWMVLDYNKFNKSGGLGPDNLSDGLLWVLEQIPNNIQADDMTSTLRTESYWPSYNVPSFPNIFNLSGNQAMVEKFGDWFTYANNPRAQIFRRDHNKVVDVESMLRLMRYNDYQHDPLSACECNPPYSAENAIAARCDLNHENGIYPFPALGHRQHGATDAKITSSSMFENNLQFLSVSGPTYDESKGIPPFQWSTSDYGPTIPHMGHPDKWTFDPLVYSWV